MGKNIIIPGANFAKNCVPTDEMLSTVIVVGNLNTQATMRSSQGARSTFAVYDKGQTNTKWATDGISDFANKADYKLNALPPLAKKIKATYSSVKLSICLFDENYIGVLSPAWSGADGVQEINIENYPTAKFFSVNIQSDSATVENLVIEYTY